MLLFALWPGLGLCTVQMRQVGMAIALQEQVVPHIVAGRGGGNGDLDKSHLRI